MSFTRDRGKPILCRFGRILIDAEETVDGLDLLIGVISVVFRSFVMTKGFLATTWSTERPSI